MFLCGKWYPGEKNEISYMGNAGRVFRIWNSLRGIDSLQFAKLLISLPSKQQTENEKTEISTTEKKR